jgi:uroporphyrin-III C-methyltransferase/precorrin-2 dehydrogenase/sirohydrochlorin ferrochelatase
MDVLQLRRNDGSARVEALAKLPVFWALEGKRVVVAGGSDAAAWKAELLAACGAQVQIYAQTLSETFEALLARGAAHPQGTLTHFPRAWDATIMSGAAIAIGDCEQMEEAQRFFDTARSAGVPVNLIDKPMLCQFQFGSIVNRSPVVIAISTDGAAPVLAQAIRQRIETLLPRTLKAWAELAQSLRASVNQRLQTASLRRLFWERFVDRVSASSDKPARELGELLLQDADELAKLSSVALTNGRVALVGAGPGDAELLTLKAVRALQTADIILFDDLVSPDVLELARREAQRAPVASRADGKRTDADDLMIRLARNGKRVVRLKMGDPMSCGRTGAEIQCLERANIPFDIVPGIPAAGIKVARRSVSAPTSNARRMPDLPQLHA